MIESIPQNVDVTQDWLVNYWAGELKVSPGRLRQVVEITGSAISKVRKHLKEGYRIAIRDERGGARLVARISCERDGLGLAVPYHPAKSGWLQATPLDYAKVESHVAYEDQHHFVVDESVKLSIHMGGFVQFSRNSTGQVISGFDLTTNRPKGAGVHAPDRINVTTGPLCGAIVEGLDSFDEQGAKPAEVFERDELWHHPSFSGPEDTAYNLEFFMFPRREIDRAQLRNGKRTMKKRLPFNGKFWFTHEVRVIELPDVDFFLGLIVSRVRAIVAPESGYRIHGPGCFDRDGNAVSLNAWYPRPPFVKVDEATSLNFTPVPKPDDGSAATSA